MAFIKTTVRFEEELLKDANFEANKRQQSTSDFVRDCVRDGIKKSQGQAVLVEGVPDCLRVFVAALKDFNMPAIDLSEVVAGTAKQSKWSMPEPEKVEVFALTEDNTDSDQDGYILSPAWQSCQGWDADELRLLTRTLRDPSLTEGERRLKRLMNALTIEELTSMRCPDFKALEAVCANTDRVIVRGPDGSWRIVWVIERPKPKPEVKISGTYRAGIDPPPEEWGGEGSDDEESSGYEEGSLDDIADRNRRARGQRVGEGIDLLRRLHPIDHLPEDIAK
jgi:hypothetical protein